MNPLNELFRLCKQDLDVEEPEHLDIVFNDTSKGIHSYDLEFEENPNKEGYLYVTLSNHNGDQLIGIYTPKEAFELLKGRQRRFR